MTDTMRLRDTADDMVSSMNSPDTTVGADCLDLEIEIECPCMGDEAIIHSALRCAVRAALEGGEVARSVPAELFVRVVDAASSQQLNSQYRQKDKPTNVLSFPATPPHEVGPACTQALEGGPPVLLGDIVIAAPVIVEEAAAQNKTVEDHLSHMAVHGVLHLIGYDHINDQDALVMEDLERKILKGIGITDPYQSENNHDG